MTPDQGINRNTMIPGDARSALTLVTTAPGKPSKTWIHTRSPTHLTSLGATPSQEPGPRDQSNRPGVPTTRLPPLGPPIRAYGTPTLHGRDGGKEEASHLVVLLGHDGSEGRGQELGQDRAEVIPDANGQRHHFREPELEDDQDSHVALRSTPAREACRAASKAIPPLIPFTQRLSLPHSNLDISHPRRTKGLIP